MEDIEKLCKEFPEIAGLVCEMFLYTRQPERATEYADKMNAYCRDKGKLILVKKSQVQTKIKGTNLHPQNDFFLREGISSVFRNTL